MAALTIDPHPLLRVTAFVTEFASPLSGLTSSDAALEALKLETHAPLSADDAIRGAVRDLLRHGGYKPTGRGKPASEYLLRVATDGGLGSINAAVDACNAVSLHSGLPISVVDLARASEPFRIGIAPSGSSYVFNASGQEIDIGGLLCLFDADGPCANAVRDAQRTKTSGETTRTLSVVWAPLTYGAQLAQATVWYRRLLEEHGATTTEAEVEYRSDYIS